MNPGQVFLVGCSRTGTTLLAGMLNRSQQICISEDSQFLHRLSSADRHRRIARIGDISDDRNLTRFVEYVYTAVGAPYWLC